MSYADFLAERAQLANEGGFTPDDLPAHLFGYQAALVEWACRTGRAGLFADCGLGKTPMALAWAEQVTRHVGRPVLFLTPLAVGQQVVAEAEKFGHDAARSRDGSVPAAITVTNYEQLAKFNPHAFGGVVCDESSILKSFDGSTRLAVTEFMRRIPHRLLATATAAPNDWTELGTSSEALGGLGHTDMLTRFFTNRQRSNTSRSTFASTGRDVGWRLKGHADGPFWRWIATWARALRRPSDMGFSDEGFELPPLTVRETVVSPREAAEGRLFDVAADNWQEAREETRRTLTERCEAAATALEDADRAVAWCHLNDESSLLARLIPGAVELTGSDSPDEKEEKLVGFSAGEIPVLVTKPRIGGWGLNWQHAHRMTYFPSDSYEQWYQAVRRMWRFGQAQEVTVDVITTPGGQASLERLHRKSAAADAMFSALVTHMHDAIGVAAHNYDTKMEVPAWLAS